MAAPQSKEDIFNLALRLLKEDAVVSIDPPDADRDAASAGADWYDQVRRDVLEEHPWKFAQKRASILKDSSTPDFEYANQYELPSDFIRVARLGGYWDDPEWDYEIESGFILTDHENPLPLVYIWDITDVTKFSPKFILCVALRLGQLMAFDLTGNATLVEVMGNRYDVELSKATSISGQNRPPRRVQKSRFKQVRQTQGNRSDWRRWGDS